MDDREVTWTNHSQLATPTHAVGGWMLLTTATSATADYSGAVVPWANSKFPQNPSRSSAYSRDWSSTGFGLLPVAGDQIMIARNSNDDYAYMTLSRWCAGAAWSASGSDPTCGGTGGHPGFGYGNFFVGSSTTATTSHYLNGCALVGGCNTGGVDGIGFSTLNGWANSAHSCYGGVCVAPLTPLHTRPTLSSWDLGLP